MIIFHEGLPGAGKTYETVVRHIIPALQSGRAVWAYIEGLNHEKFAEITGLSVERVRELLHQIEADQVPEIWRWGAELKDALVVIDEVQDFWPASREKLGPEITRFVTQHRHEGLDIILMGQDLRDCHNIWKRRVSQKVVFTQLDMLGRAQNYHWVVYKAVRPEKFKRVTSGRGRYDPKYFGLYKSHSDGTTNKDTFHDKRAIVWNHPGIKFGVPLFGVVLFFAVDYLHGFFAGESAPVAVKSAQASPTPPRTQPAVADPAPAAHRPQSAQPVAAPPPPPPRSPGVEYVASLDNQYRPRLSGYMQSPTLGLTCLIEWLDSGFHVKERLSCEQLSALGFRIEPHVFGVAISAERYDRVVTAWPVDPFGRVAQHTTGSGELAQAK